jgi:acetyl-CoA carboxylase alpha subunit
MTDQEELVERQIEIAEGGTMSFQSALLFVERSLATVGLSEFSKVIRLSASEITRLQERVKELKWENNKLATSGTDKAEAWDAVAKARKEARNKALDEAAKLMVRRVEELDEAAGKRLLSEQILRLNSRADCFEEASMLIRSLKEE